MKPSTLSARLVIAVLFFLASLSALFGGEKPAAKPDPILADLKITAAPDWAMKWDNQANKPGPPSLEIRVYLRGTAIDQASASGRVRLDSLLDEQGKSYRRACDEFCRDCMFAFWHELNGEKQDSCQLFFTIPNRPPIHAIRELRGSVTIETGGTPQDIVIDDAFKRLEDRANNDELDPDGWAKPLPDKRLQELGVIVRVARLPIDKHRATEVKDSIRIKVESKTRALVGYEVLDARGKRIPTGSNSWSGTTTLWDIYFDSPGIVPRDARLRLMFRQGVRQVHVPFTLKDIAVPKIDKNSPDILKVPASPEDAYIEAEPVAANDPILAGWKLTAKAAWRPWQGNVRPPDLTVKIEAEGAAARLASAYGEFDVESALDDRGQPLDFSDTPWEMKALLCNSDRLSIEIAAPAASPTRKVRELRGAMTIQTGGRIETIAIKHFLKNIETSGTIDDPTLKSLGIGVKVERQKDLAASYGGTEALNIGLQWKRNPVVKCEVCDAEGKRLQTSNWSLSLTGRRSVACWQSFKERLPQDAQLRISVRKDSRKIRVPFAFKDIEIPPLPKEEDDAPGPGTAVPQAQ
ncbi:MAG: hypothetical protein LLG00_15790 [Planctomycetaceae bacterium]|nr:hypothetical protein [Planctomycetaceae bacterium]